MNILLRVGRLCRLFLRRNESLRLAGQSGPVDDAPDSLKPATRPANDSEAARLGDIARKAFADRRRRADIAGTSDLFGEPAWDILLLLFIAACEGRRLSLDAACSGAQVPETTALRWIAVLEKRSLIVREGPSQRPFVKLTASANANLVGYFSRS